MTDFDSLARRVAFASYRNINIGTARRLADKSVTPDAFFELEATALGAVTGVKSAFFANDRRRQALEEGRREADFILGNRIRAVFYTDTDYPRRLAECDDAPAMLYVVGDAPLEYRHVVSVVGTRHATAYGIDFTRRLVADLAKSLDSLLVVSGLAYGIDIAAHRAALSEDVPTAAVMAHGLNTIYPADHRDEARRIITGGGFVASEYRSTDRIHKGNFLARNRIVAGMADVTVVVESDIRGGAITTANIAGAYNREVMAVPGRVYDPYSRGCNALIACCKASIARDASDVIDAAGWTAKAAEGEQQCIDFNLSEEQKRIVEHIRANPGHTVNDMCASLGVPFSRLSATLFEMEMSDILMSLPGGRYGVVSPDC